MEQKLQPPKSLSEASLYGLSKPATPINKEDFIAGTLNIPARYEIFPAKMSMLSHMNAYIVEDFEGRLYCLSIGEVHRQGWNKYEFPEVEAVKDFYSKQPVQVIE